MSDDLMEQEAPAQVADAPEAKADDLETVARELGWKPETEWKGDPPEGGFASAAEFIRSQRTRAKNVEKELKKLRNDTDKRIKRMEEQSAKERAKAIEELHGEYDWYIREAIKKGDEASEKKLIRERDAKLAEANEIDEAEDEPEADEDEWVEAFTPSYPQVQKRFYNEGHAWVLDDDADPDAMRIVLDYVDSGIPFADALEKADKALKKAYPDKYAAEDDDMDEEPEEKPKNGKRVPVLAPGGRGTGGGVSAASRLSPAQREIGSRFVKEGLFGSLEEYAEQRIKLES
jgi:hypothetical protein